MININLISSEQKKKNKYSVIAEAFKDIPMEVSVGLVGGFLILVLVINILLQGMFFLGVANTKRLEGVWQNMSSERNQVNQIAENLESLRRKIKAIDDIKNGMRISWAQKLNIISDVILPGVWLNYLSLDKDKILIKGNSVSKKGDYLTNVNRFNTALKNNGNFMKGIKSIELGSMERKNMETVSLASFTITATLDKNYEQIYTP
ncbi:MAG: PilN domain-containing protein [Candidatus Omnitrophica bacterium]|nr:PilN domain-containing protein [Candidatus Omnitrophota bacterium]